MAVKNYINQYGVRYDLADGVNIAEQESSSIASKKHENGSYFIYNGFLYVATTDIFSGSTIIPNTNCKQIKLADQINSDIFTKSSSNELEGALVDIDRQNISINTINENIDTINENIDTINEDLNILHTTVNKNIEDIKTKAEEINTTQLQVELDRTLVDINTLNEKVDNAVDVEFKSLKEEVQLKAESSELYNLAIVTEQLNKDINDIYSQTQAYDKTAGLNELTSVFVEMDKNENNIVKNAKDIGTVQSNIADLHTDISQKISKPLTLPNGTSGQVLTTNGDGTTIWSNPITPSDNQISTAVNNWLNNNPDATTTVQNESITMEKLAPEVVASIENGSQAIENSITNSMIALETEYFSNENYELLYRANLYEQNKDKLIQYASQFGNEDEIGFIFFTDSHDASNRNGLRTTYEVLKGYQLIRLYYENSPARYVLNGGDFLNLWHTKDEVFMLSGRIPRLLQTEICPYCYPVIGNHDDNSATSSSETRAITQKQIAQLWFGKDVGYYTVDTENTTCFMFDSGRENIEKTTYRAQQVQWFVNELLHNTKPHLFGLMHIVHTASHVASNAPSWLDDALLQVQDAFNRRAQITIDSDTYDFTNPNLVGTFHFMLGGHYHNDHISNRYNIPIILTTNFGYGNPFDCCYVNFDTAKLSLTRIGLYGNSRIANIIPNGGYQIES